MKKWLARIGSLIAAYFLADAFVFGFSILAGGFGGWAVFAHFTSLMIGGAAAVLLVAVPGFLFMDYAKLTSVRAGIVLGAIVGLVAGVLSWSCFQVGFSPPGDISDFVESCTAGIILGLVGTGGYWAIRRFIAWVFSTT